MKAAILAVAAALLIGSLGLLAVVGLAGAAVGALSATSSAALDIPPQMLPIYQRAATSHCSLSWEVLAAIGKAETDHGRLDATGVRTGSNSAGAMGPMQFLAGTWDAYGVDGDGDGRNDVYDPDDAIQGAANYLCANGADQPDRLRRALWAYNHDWDYVDRVLQIARSYASGPAAAGTYSLPVDMVLSPAQLWAPHHDYPAWDLPLPVGTVVHAVQGGAVIAAGNFGACGLGVIIHGDDGHRYTYCHGSSVETVAGGIVAAGDPIMRSGGRPGDPGAGRSTGPHLHLAIRVRGTSVCPQPLLAAWSRGIPADPADAPRSGCTS